MVNTKNASPMTLYEYKTSVVSFKRHTKIKRRLFCFSKSYLLILFLLTEVLTISIWQPLKASSIQQDEISSPRRRPTRTQCTGQYYYERGEDFNANDVKEIITLLANNKQYDDAAFNDLGNEDLYRIRAYFRNTNHCVPIKEFSENDFEVSSTEKIFVGLGQIQFTIKFKINGEPIRKIYTLMLLIDDKQNLPESRISFSRKEKEEGIPASPTPAKIKKGRSFSLSRFKEDCLVKAFSPHTSKRGTGKEGDTLNLHQQTEVPPSLEASRAESPLLSKSPKTQKPSSPKKERMKDIGKSLSSHFNRNKQKISHSPLPEERDNTPNFLRRSRSFPDLKAQTSFWKKSKVKSLKQRPVKELVKVFEPPPVNGS